MNQYFYMCDACGFVHIVPVSSLAYNPEGEVELEHMDYKSGEECACYKLELLQDEE